MRIRGGWGSYPLLRFGIAVLRHTVGTNHESAVEQWRENKAHGPDAGAPDHRQHLNEARKGGGNDGTQAANDGPRYGDPVPVMVVMMYVLMVLVLVLLVLVLV